MQQFLFYIVKKYSIGNDTDTFECYYIALINLTIIKDCLLLSCKRLSFFYEACTIISHDISAQQNEYII